MTAGPIQSVAAATIPRPSLAPSNKGAASATHRTQQPAKSAPPAVLTPAPQEPSLDIESEVGEVSADSGQKGVLGLLEAGHFRGVADVRLRINLFEELSQAANAKAVSAAEEVAAALTSEITTQAQELFGSMIVDEEQNAALAELLSSFRAAVESSAQRDETQTAPDSAAMTESIRAAYETLVSDLGAVFGPAPEQASDPTTIAAESDLEAMGVETAGIAEAPLAAALDSLTGSFEAALAQLVAETETAMFLPDPTPPENGNGAAYAKFLAIYSQLRGMHDELNVLI